MAVPYTFGTATASIPLSQLDSNFATVITLGNTAIQLGNTVTTLNNMTLANVTISSGNITLTNVSATTANVTTANITTAVIGTETVTTSTITTANVTTANITTANITTGTVITSLTLSYGTANGVAYLNGSKVLTTGSAFVFDGTNVGIGTSSPGAKLQVGDGASAVQSWVSGSNSGTGGGACTAVRNGSSYVAAFGNYSALLGGAYSASPVMYFVGGLQFSEAGSERMRIDSSGNVGIATTSMTGKFNVTVPSNAAFQTASYFTNAIDADIYTRIKTGVSDIGCTTSTPLTFSTASTERMRIDSSGNLLVGATVANAKLYVSGAAANGITARFDGSSNASNPLTQFITSDTTGNPYFSIYYTDSTSNRGSIQYNRGTGLMLYNTTSDYRAKDILGSVTDSGSVIDSVPVYMGKMKGATQERPMFIAHETPEYAHTGEKDAVDADGNPVYQQMDASALVPVMWAEIQSLRKRLAALESR